MAAGRDEGSLLLVATPIGNLEDITYRAVRALREADLIAAEDTRKARILLSHYQIETPTVSFFEGNATRRVPELLRRLRRGERVALVSEAGTPVISDPGFELVGACHAAGIAVDLLPGPSAVVAALVLSGLPPAPFRFLGFLPRRGKARRRTLQRIAKDTDTVVFFESPRRLCGTLEELAAAQPARRAAVARELTKLHQQVARGTLAELARLFAQPPRGEIVVVIDGAEEPAVDGEQLRQLVAAALADGARPREVADRLAHLAPRRTLYQLALALRAGSEEGAK